MKKVFLLVILFVSFQFYTLSAQEEKYICLFIYNFTKHFDWPDEVKSGDFIIQVLGHKSVYSQLKEFTSTKKVGNQNIVVRGITDISEIARCHIMFVGHWQSRLLDDILDKIGNHPTLIVTEKEGLLELGSAINFIVMEGTIKFEFKKSNASKHNLKFDPQIIQMAVKVVD